MKKKLFLLFFMLVAVRVIYAQTDSTDVRDKNHIQAGIGYTSNQTYAGRSDSLRLPVIIPSVNFKTHFGFYIKASGYLNLSKNNKGFDGISIEPGYEFSKHNWDGSIALIKNFISDSSNLIIAPVKTSIEFYLGNENKIITPFMGSEYLFSKEGNDFIAYGGLSKSLTLTKEDKEPSVTLEPSFSLSAGSQNFYYSFLKTFAANSHASGRGRSGNNSSVTQTTAEQSKQFTLLSAAFEMPITFTKSKFEWKTTPAWESPLNLVDNGGAGAQKAKSYLYISTGMLFTF
jgi:hypothetical protein